jgi:hypothetical protein
VPGRAKTVFLTSRGTDRTPAPENVLGNSPRQRCPARQSRDASGPQPWQQLPLAAAFFAAGGTPLAGPPAKKPCGLSREPTYAAGITG